MDVGPARRIVGGRRRGVGLKGIYNPDSGSRSAGPTTRRQIPVSIPADPVQGMLCTFGQDEPVEAEIESNSGTAGSPAVGNGQAPKRRRLPLVASLAIAGLAIAAVFLGKRFHQGSGSRAPVHPLEIVPLPPPVLPETSLREALEKRASNREFGSRPLEPQILSNLLWSADGINRPETGRRTAPSAYDWRHMELYLLDARGIGRYDAERHAVERLGTRDIRALSGEQDFVKDAPLTIVLVSDEGKMGEKESHGLRPIFSGVGSGAVVQNVYLYCASVGLNVVVRASIDREPLHEALELGPDQKIIVAQTIGYPPEKPSP